MESIEHRIASFLLARYHQQAITMPSTALYRKQAVELKAQLALVASVYSLHELSLFKLIRTTWDEIEDDEGRVRILAAYLQTG